MVKPFTTPTPDRVERIAREDFFDRERNLINGLSPRQINVCHEFVRNHGDWQKAVKKHHDVRTVRSLQCTVTKYRNNPMIAAFIERLIVDEGIPVKMVGVVKSAMDATFVHPKTGIEYPDHRARLMAVRECCRMLGIPAKQQPQTATAEEAAEMAELEKALADEPPAVLEWASRHGRLPNREERKRILEGLPEPDKQLKA